MGADEGATLDALIGRWEILYRLTATMGRMATSRALRRLVYMWAAAAVIFALSLGEAAAQAKSGKAAGQPKRILLLHTFGPNFEQGAAWSREFQKALNRQSPWPLNIQEQSLVTALDGDPAAEAKFVEYLAALYAQRPLDLIVTLGAAAAHFIQRHRAVLSPSTPMLLAAIELRRVEPSMLSEQDAVAGARLDQAALVENILRLLPETKTIAYILGTSPPERFWAAEAQRVLGPLLKNKVELIPYGEQPFEEILKALASLPPDSAIFYQQLAVDGAGAIYGDKDPLKRIYEVANAPIFSYDDTYFNGQIVGGPMFSPAEGALPMAAAAIRMLGGEKASDIKVPPIDFSTPKYDWRLLQRWNISESRLPPGSEILFREPTVWQRYSWQIAFIIALILVQAGLISVLLRERGRRQLAEVQSRQRMVELAHVNRFSTAGELTASIAHEINQPLGAILANAETAQSILTAPDPDIVELNNIVDDIILDDRRASEVIRRIRSLLRNAPFETKNFDLNELVRETTKFLAGPVGARRVEINSSLSPLVLPIMGDRVQLQQVVLNLIVNAMDAMANVPRDNRKISLRTSRVDNFAELSISDNGPGIAEEKLKKIFEPFFTSKAEGMGMGLSIARTIVEAHNGRIWAANQPGGAVFRIKIPLEGTN